MFRARTLQSAGGAEGGAKDKKKNSGDAGRGFSVDYPLYRSFWRLQRYALEQDKAVKGEEAKQTWEDLLGDVDKARPRKTDDSEVAAPVLFFIFALCTYCQPRLNVKHIRSISY